MHKIKKRIFIIFTTILTILISFAIISSIIGTYLYYTADFLEPDIDVDLNNYSLQIDSDSIKTCDYGSLKLNKFGLLEVTLRGTSIDRGVAYGMMLQEYLEYQEDIFVNQIYKMVSSEVMVNFLHKLIGIFNRDMAKHIPSEYREEIYAISLSCTNKYNSYGSPYVRQLNYHAAHDIGHTLQQYMLVGCSSFAIWGEESENKDLIVGRNFDFYVGDDFAKNKVVLFVEPIEGNNFVSISWPGMMGILSGMNENGLTVTINAAKGTIPTSSAMPISLLARQILQYASNISEAYEIAQNFNTFVSESLLVSSAKDGYAAIIEKTPSKTVLYKNLTSNTRIVCTNHFQSESFKTDKYNIENIETSDSYYRWYRINELLDEQLPINPQSAVTILRNRHGIKNEDIGICNEKSINQFIAHHSVVFQPNELRMWVSTSPWQVGEYVCYDLDYIFQDNFYIIDSLNIKADSSQIINEYKRAIKYKSQYEMIRQTVERNAILSTADIDGFISNNPMYFQVYNILGDYMLSRDSIGDALFYWQKALSLEIPRLEEREQIIEKIQKYD